MDEEDPFAEFLAELKARHPDFDRQAERGKLMMRKRAGELTPSERAFLEGNAEKMN